MTFPFRVQQNFPQLYILWYAPKKQKFPKTVIWNKTCCYLMSTFSFQYCKRSLTTHLSFPFVLATVEKEKQQYH